MKGTVHEDLCTFMVIPGRIFLRMGKDLRVLYMKGTVYDGYCT